MYQSVNLWNCRHICATSERQQQVSNVWGENGVREKYWCHLFNLPDTKVRKIINKTGLYTNSKNDWSSFDTQLRNFEENVAHQWLRLAGWGFYKVASTGKIVTKSHSDAAVLFAHFRQQWLWLFFVLYKCSISLESLLKTHCENHFKEMKEHKSFIQNESSADVLPVH